MILYLNPGGPNPTSGGTRKLLGHVEMLKANGFLAMAVDHGRLAGMQLDPSTDIVIVPEVYGDFLNYGIPHPVRRVGFVQNSYLTMKYGCHDPVNNHPFMVTEDLVAIFTESQHTEDRMREMFPNLQVPLIRTHSSGNDRNGQDAGFVYGEWPREKRVVFFAYKHEHLNGLVFDDLPLPSGWSTLCLAGMSDAEIAHTMRTSAIFAAPNIEEGLCAPTQEALLSGAIIVAWPGGPTGQKAVGGPLEYTLGRSVLAIQDDITDLREKIVATACSVDNESDWWAAKTREWADWHRVTYSREREITEICQIFTELGFGPS